MPRNTVTFENVEGIKKSDAALLCKIDGVEHWIPQSQITDDSEVFDEGHVGDLVVTEWIALQRKLI